MGGRLIAQRGQPPDLGSLADEILSFGLRGLLAR